MENYLAVLSRTSSQSWVQLSGKLQANAFENSSARPICLRQRRFVKMSWIWQQLRLSPNRKTLTHSITSKKIKSLQCLFFLPQTYLAPELPKFGHGSHTDLYSMYNNYRCYASGLLLLEFIIVACGVKVVQIFAPVSLLAVIVSIISIYIGSFVASPENSAK